MNYARSNQFFAFHNARTKKYFIEIEIDKVLDARQLYFTKRCETFSNRFFILFEQLKKIQGVLHT